VASITTTPSLDVASTTAAAAQAQDDDDDDDTNGLGTNEVIAIAAVCSLIVLVVATVAIVLVVKKALRWRWFSRSAVFDPRLQPAFARVPGDGRSYMDDSRSCSSYNSYRHQSRHGGHTPSSAYISENWA